MDAEDSRKSTGGTSGGPDARAAESGTLVDRRAESGSAADSDRERSDVRDQPTPEDTDRRAPTGDAAIDDAVDRARRHLLDLQNEDGHWRGEMEGDTILESEYMLTLLFAGWEPDHPKFEKTAEYIRRKQKDSGGWGVYPDGPVDVSASVKAYFVLKIVGDDPDAAHMRKARETIREHGGVEATNSFTKLYLALFDQYDWEKCPAIPPEMVLLPTWFPFNLYEMSSWTRTIVVPLAILWAKKPTREPPNGADIDELHVDHPDYEPVNSPDSVWGAVWYAFFTILNWLLIRLERVPFNPLRERALDRAEEWIVERLDKSDGLGAIFPPINNTIMALVALGHDPDSELVEGEIDELLALEGKETEETLRIQPCLSPVWDTSQTLAALQASLKGEPDDNGHRAYAEAMDRAAKWLLDREVDEPGDWTYRNPDAPVGGWYFEYANEWYPDHDDTAEIILDLSEMEFEDEEIDRQRRDAMERGERWLIAQQNDDGGWAAFDRGIEMEVLEYVPFADHNAMLDPSCVDITSRVLEALTRLGYTLDDDPVRRGADFILENQLEDGTWYGRWGCNYIYGTWLAVAGLETVGVDLDEPRFERSAEWLKSVQNDDGGWGERPRSYEDVATKGDGPSTAAQTSWAVLGLMALGEIDSEEVRRGIDYLLETQHEDGRWEDEPWTGTGFPEVFYLRYHFYPKYFPLLAISEYRNRRRGGRQGV